MERKVGALAAGLLLLAMSCNASQISSTAKVTVDGKVQRGSAPVADARVALMKEPDAGDIFLGVVSIGLSCLEADFSECGESKIATSGRDGSFTYDLKGSDTQGHFGNASVLELTTALAKRGNELAGPGVSTRFQVQTPHVTIPLQLWEPVVSITGAGNNIAVRWTEPSATIFPPEADLASMHRSVEFLGPDAQQVWKAPGRPGGADLDARLLEDTQGGTTVFATIGDIKTPPARGTDVEVLARSARYGYTSPVGAPPSRGRPCTVPDAKGRAVVQSPCGLTDGNFSDSFVVRTCSAGDTSCSEPNNKQVTIDLGRPVKVTLVVVRGCAGDCAAEASQNGSVWTRVAGNASNDVGGRDVAMPVDEASARYVRITSANGLHDLHEVSVWDPRKLNLHGPFVVAPDAVPKGRLTHGAPKSSGNRWLLLAAFVAVVLAIAIAAYAVGRRRATGSSSATTSRGTP